MAILFLSSCSHPLFAGFSTVLVATPRVNCYRECGGEGEREGLQAALDLQIPVGTASAAPQFSWGWEQVWGRVVMLKGFQCLLLLEANVKTRQRMQLLFHFKRIPSHCFPSVECLGFAYWRVSGAHGLPPPCLSAWAKLTMATTSGLCFSFPGHLAFT